MKRAIHLIVFMIARYISIYGTLFHILARHNCLVNRIKEILMICLGVMPTDQGCEYRVNAYRELSIWPRRILIFDPYEYLGTYAGRSSI